jgi:hypothetical protein
MGIGVVKGTIVNDKYAIFKSNQRFCLVIQRLRVVRLSL